VAIADGPAGEVILAHAANADLVVMGTNDRGKAARLWMGSVAERVSRHAHVPVLVVHASESGSVQDYLKQLADEARRRSNG
jgi:nucleotide-binding universal stress UspA family protein